MGLSEGEEGTEKGLMRGREWIYEGQGMDIRGTSQHEFSEPEHRYSEPNNRRRATEGIEYYLVKQFE